MSTASELPESLAPLAEAARTAQTHAYAPYSRYRVGAAITSDAGGPHAGCNVEIVHYKGVCAEASAISAMVAAGGRVIRELVISAPNAGPPCGDCRQRIFEFSGPETRIHSLDAAGRLARTDRITDLLPDAFGPEALENAG